MRKAYDTVEHKWLSESMDVHRFHYWLCKEITQLLKSWNSKIIVGVEPRPPTVFDL